MNRIKQLPVEVANQIAAGEVIERPASVIKELLENALDANAHSIRIEIEKGGMGLCRVRDDGDGIAENDLPLALAPHATSKIQDVNDLMQLHSLGFRGEALASISSVSQFTIRSKPKSQAFGAEIYIDSDRQYQQQSAHPDGTTIEVKELFYNVPVRRKFLKGIKTEFSHIEAVVKRVALSCLDLAIQLSHNGRLILNLPPAHDENQQLKRYASLLGKPFMETAIAFEQKTQAYQLSGFLGSPHYLRSQNDIQYLFLNGRMVRDKLLMHAIRQVYEPYLYPGRVPCFAIYLEMAAEDVDVNVHPTKHEVRFKYPRDVHDFIVSALARALERNESVDADQQGEDNAGEQADTDAALSPLPESKTVAEPLATGHSAAYVAELSSTAHGSLFQSLSDVHGLFVSQGNSYLFQVNQLYQSWLAKRIETLLAEAQSLVARPVLVPLMVELTSEQIEAFPIDACRRYGLQLHQMSATALSIRGFPIITPHLNLKQTIEQIAKEGETVIGRSLASCNTVSLRTLSEEEKQALAAFILEQGAGLECVKCLSQSQWQEVLDGKA